MSEIWIEIKAKPSLLKEIRVNLCVEEAYYTDIALSRISLLVFDLTREQLAKFVPGTEEKEQQYIFK